MKTENFLQSNAVALSIAACIASPVFSFWAGRHNPSFLLNLMFMGWVTLPFMAGLLLQNKSGDWTAPSRKRLWLAMIAMSVLSITVFGYVSILEPPIRKAAPFLVTPAVEWTMILWAVRGRDKISPGKSQNDS